jgi:hypothetical protein
LEKIIQQHLIGGNPVKEYMILNPESIENELSEDEDFFNETSEIISETFDISAAPSIDVLRNMLAVKLDELLLANVEKLLSIMYRIDVTQHKLDEIFAGSTREEIPYLLADAIIERQLKKVKTRHYYKNKEGGIIDG